MTTQIITGGDLTYAANTIRGGGLCIIPTETVYGLATNGLSAAAVRKLYEVKQRPPVKPISLLVPSIEAAAPLVTKIPPDAKKLAAKFMPGPLTLILPKSDAVPDIVTAGSKNVGIRVPDHPKTRELLELSGVPFACPSANLSGMPSPKTVRDALVYFAGLVGCAVDGGECTVGTESTVLDMTVYPYRVLRRGALTKRAVAECLGQHIDGLTIIGITGPTGAGKTTALRALDALGALVIDCDTVYRELTESNAEMLAALDERFNGVVKNGVLDRRALAGIVFTDPDALKDLNEITHGFVDRECFARMAEFHADGGRAAAVDAIALIESGLAAKCDLSVAVTASRETRLERIIARDGITPEAANLRIDAQKPDEFYIDGCDAVLRNENIGEDEFFKACVNSFTNLLEEI